MVFKRPEKLNIFWRQFINEADKLILSSILLVGVISVFIGGVLVIQTASNLEKIYGKGKSHPGILFHYDSPDPGRKDGIQYLV